MKNIYLIFTLIFLFGIFNSLEAQQTKKGRFSNRYPFKNKKEEILLSKKRIIEKINSPLADYTLPTSSMDSIWVDNEWVLNSQSFYEYDEQRRVTVQSTHILEDDEWINNERQLLSYNEFEDVEEEIWQEWDGSDWANIRRELFLKNEQGDLIEDTDYEWDGGNWVVIAGERYNYTYEEDRITSEEIEEVVFGTNEFETVATKDFSYDDRNRLVFETTNDVEGPPISRIHYQYENEDAEKPNIIVVQAFDEESGEWLNQARYRDLEFEYWHNKPYNYEFLSFYLDEWSEEDGEFQEYLRGTKELQEYGSYVYTEDSYVDGEWENEQRYTEMYDQYGHYRGYVDELYNEDWEIQASDMFDYYFNESGQLLHIIDRFWDIETEEYVNFMKITFREGIVASNNLKLEEINLTVFPNPGTGLYKLKTDIASASITLADSKGQKVNALITEEEDGYSINIQNLPHGIYLLNLITIDNNYVVRIIKN